MNNFFTSIFTTTGATTIAPSDFLLYIAVSLLIGVFLTWIYIFRSHYTVSFAITLTMLPAIVCMVIMMVNGNVGAGVAVAGAFSLVRFRSAPGTAKEIGAIFLAMAAGLVTGMGYLGYAALFAVVMGAVLFGLNLAGAKAVKQSGAGCTSGNTKETDGTETIQESRTEENSLRRTLQMVFCIQEMRRVSAR